jgi:hypothetical protein
MNFGTFAGEIGSTPVLRMPITNTQMITVSTTWVAPMTGTFLIYAVGGGGGGNEGFGAHWVASGGGAGGFAIKAARLQLNDALTITIGAGGTKGTSPTAGGATTVYGAGLNILAGGGGAGSAIIQPFFSAAVSGGTGGTATGGDWNLTGGAGGSASLSPYGGGYEGAMSGGGAVAWFGQAYRGGNATCNNVGYGYAYGGGAGIGGRGGDATILNNPDGNYAIGSGGGATAPGQDVSSASIIQGQANLSLTDYLGANSTNYAINTFFFPFGRGTGSTNTTVAGGFGAGTRGYSGPTSQTAGVSGMFAGTGAGVSSAGVSAGLGGGGGAGTNGGNTRAASGGAGVVFIVWGWQ